MKKLIALVFALSPGFAFAQTLTDINSVGTKATNLGTLVIQIIISLSVLWIIISIFRYLVAGSPDGRKEGGMAILYGVIALFLMFSIWGLVYILKNSFTFSDNTVKQSDLNNIRVPALPPVPNN